MKPHAFLCLFGIGASTCSLAQVPPSIEWEGCFGGSDTDWGWAGEQTADGGYIICGEALSMDSDVVGSHGDIDTWVVKLDDTGDLTWQKPLGGSAGEYATSILQTPDGGYVTCVTTVSTDGDVTGSNGLGEVWVVKLDAAGSLVWEHAYGGSQDDFAYDIKRTTDGGFVVVGLTTSSDGDVTGYQGAGDCWILRLDSAGALLWQKTIGGSSYEHGWAINQTSDGGFIIAGNTFSEDGDITGHHGEGDYWIAKVDSLGALEWQRSMGGSLYDEALAVHQTMDGGYIASGIAHSNDGDVSAAHGLSEFWVVKLNANGILLWEQALGGSGNDFSSHILQTDDGGFIATGESTSTDGDLTSNQGMLDVWVVKLDPNGAITWQKSYGGSDTDRAGHIVPTSDGGYLVTGSSMSIDGDVSGGNGVHDIWVVKLSGSAQGVEEPPARTLSMSPNPTSGGELFITANELHSNGSTAVIAFHDLVGRQVASYSASIADGTLQTALVLPTSMASGVYDVHVTADDVRFSARLVVQ